MTSPLPNRLGACSWSLRARTTRELADAVRAVGVDAVQLALDPLREGVAGVGEVRSVLSDAGIEIRSGMIGMVGEDYSTLESIRATGGVRPDEHWPRNLANARASARVARELGLPLVTFHAGFLPEEEGAERTEMVRRLRAVVDAFAGEGVGVAFETGQETAETLLSVLEELERPAAGVNFDPANMILYDRGEPVEALRRLAGRVRQIHVKDAVRARVPGEWGEEVRAGDGEVDWAAFFGAVREAGLACDLMIEREAGDDRALDVRAAAELVRRHARTPAGGGSSGRAGAPR